ncbi:MAG: inorganic phosphate transporter [bacterium]|nr:inorganic phosphate transporter [bacterium]
MVTIIFFLSSGLFLGWSLGANDAANVFGTAVGTKMVKFKTAALICSIFVILGAVLSGAGASHTLGKLGKVNALPGAFTVAFAAAFTVFWMTKLKLPVSTSQSIVGAIIGWNIFVGFPTDYNTLTKIVSTWIICPVLAGVLAAFFYFIFKNVIQRIKVHMIWQDTFNRWGLILVGAFGSYSLGANNIANVMGVFTQVSPFREVDVMGLFDLSSTQQLFLLGGIAISVGVFTYSRKVMNTVGSDLFELSPVAALIVVLASATVLFLFASQGLKTWLEASGLPSLPLVPVSSSQAVVGAILGIGIAKSGHNINYGTLGKISVGWLATPVMSGVIAYVLLFFMKNVFMQVVRN